MTRKFHTMTRKIKQKTRKIQQKTRKFQQKTRKIQQKTRKFQQNDSEISTMTRKKKFKIFIHICTFSLRIYIFMTKKIIVFN